MSTFSVDDIYDFVAGTDRVVQERNQRFVFLLARIEKSTDVSRVGEGLPTQMDRFHGVTRFFSLDSNSRR